MGTGTSRSPQRASLATARGDFAVSPGSAQWPGGRCRAAQPACVSWGLAPRPCPPVWFWPPNQSSASPAEATERPSGTVPAAHLSPAADAPAGEWPSRERARRHLSVRARAARALLLAPGPLKPLSFLCRFICRPGESPSHSLPAAHKPCALGANDPVAPAPSTASAVVGAPGAAARPPVPLPAACSRSDAPRPHPRPRPDLPESSLCS